MDLIFQFGEFINEGDESSIWYQSLIEFIGASLGFLFALYLFYQQIKKDRKKENENRVKSYRDLLYYYKELLISSIDKFNKQLDSLDDFIQRQEKDLTELMPLHLGVTNDFLRLKNIDNKGVFEAWTTLFNDDDIIKQYKNNNARTDFLEKNFVEIEQMHKGNTKHIYDLLFEVRSIIEHIPDTLAMMSRQFKAELGESSKKNDEFMMIQSFLSIYTELMSLGGGFTNINIKFISPLLEIYLNNQGLYNSDEILMLCKKARVKLNSIESEQKQNIEKFKEIRGSTKKSIEELEKTIEKIDTLLKAS